MKCHHCKKPILDQPVSFNSENQSSLHYHEDHAHHHGRPTRSQEADWRSETELSDEATTPSQRADAVAERKLTKGARAKVMCNACGHIRMKPAAHKSGGAWCPGGAWVPAPSHEA